MQLSDKQKERISKILEDLGKLIFAMGVIAPVVSQANIKLSRIALFFAFSLILFAVALSIDKGGE